MKKIKIAIVLFFALALCICSGFAYYYNVALTKIREQEKSQEWYKSFYAGKLEEYKNENNKYSEFEVDVAFLGDSITDGYDVKSYYPEYLVTNRGIGGDTTHGLKDRLDVSVLTLKPKVCVMLIGINNLDTMFEDYEEILISFKEKMPDTKIVLVSIPPMSAGLAYRNETAAYNNVKIKILAEKYGYEYVDIYSPLLDLETGEMKSEYTPDGLHHTPEGYKVITKAIKPVVDNLLK